jgi:DNA-binding CsgD family transcriptional regulator/tetratricopeptide (TPR) repeat protein
MSRVSRETSDYSALAGRERLAAAASDSLTTPGRAVTCLVGEAGIGKTTVWSAVLDRAAVPVVARLTCFEAEAGVGWTTLGDLLSALITAIGDDCLAGLPVAQRQAVDVILLRGAADRLPVPLDPRLAGSVLLSLLRLLPESLIGIDDLQWCDAQSYDAVCFALRRGEGLKAGWLISRRPAGDRELPGERVLMISPMDGVDLRAVVIEHLARNVSPMVLEELVHASGGNPFYALEIVRSLPDDPTPDDVLRSPSTSDLVVARLARLPVAATRALVDVAVRAAVWRDYERLADLDAAFEHGILHEMPGRGISFTHPLLAAGVLAGAPPGALAAAHRRAADLSADVVVRARHLAAATTGPDDDIAAQLDDAVKVALARGDKVGAARLAERALALSEETATRWDRLAAAARTGALVFDPRADGWARQLIELSAAGPQRARAYLALAAATPNNMPAGLAAAERALQEPGIGGELRGEVLSAIGVALMVLGRHREAASILAEAAQAMQAESPAWADVVGTWTLACRISGQPVDVAQLAHAAELARLGVGSQQPLVTMGLIAMYDDRHDVARSVYAEAIAIADATGAYDEGRFHLAELMVRTGELTDAVQLSRELATTSDGQDLAAVTWVLAIAYAWLGDEAACRTAAAQCRELSRAASDELFWVASEVASGFLELTLGHYDAAWTSLDESARAMERQDFEEPSCFPVLPAAIEAATALGKVDDAKPLLDRLTRQAAALNSRWAAAAVLRARGQLAAGHDTPSALHLLADAADAYQELRLHLERARTLLARGAIARRNRQRSVARGDLSRALDIFDLHEAKILSARTRDEIAKLGGRPASGGKLTASELATAQLAAAGLSNAAIAHHLSVSIKTVEAHLGRAFHKLGVHSRVQLTNVLAHPARPSTMARETDRPSG